MRVPRRQARRRSRRFAATVRLGLGHIQRPYAARAVILHAATPYVLRVPADTKALPPGRQLALPLARRSSMLVAPPSCL